MLIVIGVILKGCKNNSQARFMPNRAIGIAKRSEPTKLSQNDTIGNIICGNSLQLLSCNFAKKNVIIHKLYINVG